MLQSKVRKFDFTPIRYYSHLSAYILSVGRNVQCPPTLISVARTGSGTKRPAPQYIMQEHNLTGREIMQNLPESTSSRAGSTTVVYNTTQKDNKD